MQPILFKMSDKHRINRKFERLLFDGIPERPEPSFQRELHADAGERHTLKPLNGDLSSEDGERVVMAQLNYFIDEETIEIEYV